MGSPIPMSAGEVRSSGLCSSVSWRSPWGQGYFSSYSSLPNGITSYLVREIWTVCCDTKRPGSGDRIWQRRPPGMPPLPGWSCPPQPRNTSSCHLSQFSVPHSTNPTLVGGPAWECSVNGDTRPSHQCWWLSYRTELWVKEFTLRLAVATSLKRLLKRFDKFI